MRTKLEPPPLDNPVLTTIPSSCPHCKEYNVTYLYSGKMIWSYICHVVDEPDTYIIAIACKHCKNSYTISIGDVHEESRGVFGDVYQYVEESKEESENIQKGSASVSSS